MKEEKRNNTKEEMIKGFSKCLTFTLAAKYVLIGIAVIFLFCLFGSIIEEIVNLNGNNVSYVIFDTIKFFVKDTGILNMIKYVLIIFWVDVIAKMFKNSIENETPFSKENVKNMRLISNISFIYLICSNSIGYELIVYLLITAISFMFKYGYQLQIESDETL